MELKAAFLLLLLRALASSQAQKPCLPQNRVANEVSCLGRIRDAIFDENQFFFGRNLDAVCDNTAQNDPDNFNCYTDDEKLRRYSLASRLFGGVVKTEGIDRYLTVTFSSLDGKYKACGGSYSVDKSTTDANPDMSPAKPVDVRNKPKFDMRAERDASYTIVVMDATYGFVHGLFTNFPTTKDIIPFTAPLNFRNITNTFVFIVYRQPEVDYMLEPRQVTLMKSPALAKKFSLNDFVSEHGLVGPVAMNWMQVKYDAWAVQQVLDKNGPDVDYCIMLVREAFRKMDVKFMDQDFSKIDMKLNVTLFSTSLSFPICCQTSAANATSVTLSPLAYQNAGFGFLQTQPVITAEKTILRSTANERLYTIMIVDPDAPNNLAIPQLPFMNWIFVNLLEDNFREFAQSRPILPVLLPYMEPVVNLAAPNRRLFYLLYEQKEALRTTGLLPANNQAADQQCKGDLAGRCMFPLKDFVSQNHLVLRGINWVNTTIDAYGRNKLLKLGQNEDEVCRSQPGYVPSCSGTPTGKDFQTTPIPKGSGIATTPATNLLCVLPVIFCLCRLNWFS